jgi:hypothetical protein
VAVEGGQAVVGKDDVGPELPERAGVGFSRRDVPQGEFEAGPLELGADELDVRCVIFEEQDADRFFLRLSGLRAAAGLLREGGRSALVFPAERVRSYPPERGGRGDPPVISGEMTELFT